jgi:hypothetical protein
MGIRDWDIVTSYVDSVTTSLKTVTFPKIQEQVKVKNQGNANLTYTIGSQSGTLTPGQSVTVNESISSFTIQAVSGTQAFELRAKEKGTEQTETETDVISQLQSQSEKSGLSGWYRDFAFNRNKNITTIGDSTSDNTTGALYIWQEIANYFTGSGDSMEGVTFTHRGANGNTLSNFINNTSPTGKNLNDAIADQADLYILSYGINDVRLGATSQQQLIDMLDTAIQSLLKNTKGYILLRVPNSFLLDDPTSSGWLQPLSSAQAYTDLIWNAYMSFKGKNARVGILDTQTLLFGRTCQTKANNQLMNDVLHPSTTGTTGGGYQNLGRLIATCIGITKPTRDDLIYSAIVQNSAKPYLVYPRYLESKPDQYELIAQGYFVGIGSNYLDFAFDGTQAYKIQIGDIIKVGDWATFDFLTGTATASGANTRIAGGITFANYASANKGIVKIFRKKGTNKVAKSFFGKSTINGQVLGDFTIPQAMRISAIRCVTTTPIGATIDLKLRKYYQNTVKDIATISFAINNMTAVTITWDATNAPNSYLDTNSDDIYTLECTSTTYTGTVSFNLTLS